MLQTKNAFKEAHVSGLTMNVPEVTNKEKSGAVPVIKEMQKSNCMVTRTRYWV